MDNELNLPAVLADIEDYLIPRKILSVWERSLYYHLPRHSRFQGDEIKIFAIQPLAQAFGMSQSSVRQAIRSLHDKGCARIEKGLAGGICSGFGSHPRSRVSSRRF